MYMANQNCLFNFEAPSGKKILVFFEEVDLEEGYDELQFRKSHNIEVHFLVFS